MTVIGRDSKIVIDTRTAREGRSSCSLAINDGCEIKSSLHTYTLSEGHHTYSVSVLAPDRAFYLSSVSNNLVKLRTPRMGYRSRERRTHLCGREDEAREKEDERRARRKDQQPAVLSLVSSGKTNELQRQIYTRPRCH